MTLPAKILAIDPGPVKSGYVVYQYRPVGSVLQSGHMDNFELLGKIRLQDFGGIAWPMALCMEKIAAMGMVVGGEVFETVYWSGRLIEAWDQRKTRHGESNPFRRIKRTDVKLHLCGSTRAKDPNVNAAIWDRFGGSRKAAFGTKAKPGPLYGVTSHAIAALAVAITAVDTWEQLTDESAGGTI